MVCCLILLRLHFRISTGFCRSLDQPSERKVIHNVLDPLHVILDSVSPLPQDVVLEVQQLEPGEEVLDKGADDEGQVEIAEGDGVGGQAGEFLGELGEGEEILLEGEVEGVAVFDVSGDAEDGTDLV